ncbi:MAG: hypothetical protein N2A42_08650 [Luteolibacter sp.]
MQLDFGNAGKGCLQPVSGFVGGAPVFDVGHIERFSAFNGSGAENFLPVNGVLEIR